MNVNLHKKDVLGLLLANKKQPFALLYRPDAQNKDMLDVLIGAVEYKELLSDISLPVIEKKRVDNIHDKLILLPYKQISERGFKAKDDGTPLVSMDIVEQDIYPINEVLSELPDSAFELNNARFNLSDEDYAATVKNILDQEIGQGKGASFVLQRAYTAELGNDYINSALGIFKKLLAKQAGAYWVFVIHTGERVLVGATPERHITLEQELATMNPISGTYRYPITGPKLTEITQFLENTKEADELYMVVDEELKMMTRLCHSDVVVKGPMLKEMSFVAHTEYFIQGKSSMDPINILKETMFAPSVTGSPQESAARVINKYEPEGRGYYSGVVALIGQQNGNRKLDSSILIRTADINSEGHLSLSVGATLVRGSDPLLEADETKAKASGVLAAIGAGIPNNFSHHPDVLNILASRNHSISDFWLAGKQINVTRGKALSGKKILIVDEEDTFTSMIKYQLLSLNCDVTLRRYDEEYSFDDGYDLIVMGPGPGDPNDLNDSKISHLYTSINELLTRQQPFLAVCLSHQVLSSLLGLKVMRRSDPNQGVQKNIDLFGQQESVGFYNSFSAHCNSSHIPCRDSTDMIEVSFDPQDKEVHALRSEHFCGVQFHPESILTIDGVRIFEEMLTHLLKRDNRQKHLFTTDKVA